MRFRPLFIALAVILFVLAQVLGFCFIPGTDIALYLAFGWIPYLFRVLPQLSVRWDMAVSAAAYAFLLAAGGHLFLRWLYREMKRADAPTETPPVWKWRWTLGGLLVVLLMFAAGTAAVGFTHQTAWLVRSPETLYRPGSARRDKHRCESNLRLISRVLRDYAREHDGRYPDDLASLVGYADLQPHECLCPATLHRADDRPTTQQALAALSDPSTSPYVYFGRGLVDPDPKRVVVIVELLENHEGEGINVLYSHGAVRWYDRPDAEALLLNLGFRRVESPPAKR